MTVRMLAVEYAGVVWREGETARGKKRFAGDMLISLGILGIKSDGHRISHLEAVYGVMVQVQEGGDKHYREGWA